MLSGAALYNGFPLVWYDTADHIDDAITGHINWARTIVYSLFLRVFHHGVSLWPPVFVQAAIAAYMLRVTFRVVVGPGRNVAYLAVVSLLSVLSSLPWFAGQLMPDVFAGLAVLGMFLLGFALDRLSRGERIAVLAFTTLSIAVHLSHLPIALGLLAAVPVVGFLSGAGRSIRWRSLATVGGAVALAVGAAVSTNIVYRDRPAISPNGQIFVLARLVADGPATSYLREHCGKEHFALCSELGRLPMDATSFLWRRSGPLERLGIDTLRAEAGPIVAGTIRSYPLWTLELAARNTITQLRRFDTGWEYGPYVERAGAAGAIVPRVLRRYFSASFERYRRGRQNMGTLPLDAMLWPHRLAVLVSLLVTIVVLARRGRRDPMMAALILWVGASVLIAAVVTGVISGPTDRYGSRMVWPIVFAALMGIIPRPILHPPPHLATCFPIWRSGSII